MLRARLVTTGPRLSPSRAPRMAEAAEAVAEAAEVGTEAVAEAAEG